MKSNLQIKKEYLAPYFKQIENLMTLKVYHYPPAKICVVDSQKTNISFLYIDDTKGKCYEELKFSNKNMLDDILTELKNSGFYVYNNGQYDLYNNVPAWVDTNIEIDDFITTEYIIEFKEREDN